MSVNNNPNTAPLDNPFADLGSLKDAKLTPRETSILSKCNYEDLKTKWSEGLNNISNNAHTHMRNAKEVKESFFCYLGNVLGLANSEPLKEVRKVFSNFDLFDRYVRNDISQEMYKKIAKANPAYFDKVIKHLEDSAKELDIKADARIGTFCSSSTGCALAKTATRFRDTADYLKRMMHGDDAAKPGNNNANPGADRGQPTIINHYHNNIGHIGDINIGHLGDNNFYNKGGNMAVMFKKSSNGVPHTGFRPEYSVSKTENLFYSPTINGMKFLDVTAENALKLLGQGEKDEGKENKENLEFKAQKPLSKENPENIKQQVDSINLKPEEKENNAVEDNKKDLSEARVQTEGNGISIQRPISENSFITKERITKGNNQKDDKVQQTDNKNAEKTNKTTDINSVQSEKNSAETILTNLKKLRDKYYRLWDKIHQDKEAPKTTTTSNDDMLNKMDINRQMQILKTDSSFKKLEKLSMQIKNLNKKLATMDQKKTINGQQLSSASPDLQSITDVIDNSSIEAAIEKQPVLKTGNTSADENHGLSWGKDVKNKSVTEEENNMSPDEAREYLAEETQKLLEDIRKELGLEPLKKK